MSNKRNPFPAKNQTLRSYRVYISLSRSASSVLIQIESNRIKQHVEEKLTNEERTPVYMKGYTPVQLTYI